MQNRMDDSSIESTQENISTEITTESSEISFTDSEMPGKAGRKSTKAPQYEDEFLGEDEDEVTTLEASDEDEEEVVVEENIFETWNISKETLKSLKELNFTTPTPIQKQAIPLLLKREKDFVGLAATGTGKTGAFGIPLVEAIDASSKSVQALVMCPTRELASQVEAQLQKMAKWKGLSTLTVFGGSSYDRQITALKRGVHIVVGTPGRLCDLIDRKVLKLNDVQTLILDEADEMISMGFQDDLEKILEAIGDADDKRKWLFSATMSPEIRRVVSRYLPDYDKVEIHKEDSQKPNIEQVYYTIYPDRKLQMLSSVLYMNPEFYGLIFCQTKREVTEITDWLKRKSFKVDCIHGDRPQRERDFILKDFRTGRVKILVATDVAARGLDINDLTHVINFSLPREVESYVHRIGRTGRAGKKGLALSIVAPHEVRLLKRIQQVTKATLTKGVAPSNDELNLYRVKDVINSMNQIEDRDVYNRASKFIDKKIEDLKESFSFEFTVEEFLKRLLVSEHPDIFENRETSMDFVGDGIVPREMQEYGSRQRGDAGRDSSGPRGFDRGGGRGGGYSRGGGRSFGGGRGGYSRNEGGGERRSWNDDRGGERSERSARPERRPWGASEAQADRGEARSDRGESRLQRPERKSWSDDRGPRSENTERAERGPRGRTDGARSEGRFDKSSDKKGPRGLRSRSAAGSTTVSGFKSWNADDSGSDRPRQRKSYKDAR
jgi:ATP-dependent RNA helicase DeaD